MFQWLHKMWFKELYFKAVIREKEEIEGLNTLNI